MSTSASGRPPIARTSETLVTTAAEPAPNGSAASERRRDRLAAHHELLVAGGDERGVVAVDAEPRPLEQLRSRLPRGRARSAPSAARAEVGHRARLQPERALQRVRSRQPRAVAFADALRTRGAGGRGRLAPAGRRGRRGRGAPDGCGGRTATRSPRPTARRGADRGARAARGVGRAGGRGRPRARGRHAAALRAADRVGARLRPAAPGAASRRRLRGLGARTATTRRRAARARRDRAEPGNEHGHVGPMTGVCSPSMPVWVVEDARSAPAPSRR